MIAQAAAIRRFRRRYRAVPLRLISTGFPQKRLRLAIFLLLCRPPYARHQQNSTIMISCGGPATSSCTVYSSPPGRRISKIGAMMVVKSAAAARSRCELDAHLVTVSRKLGAEGRARCHEIG